MPKNVDESIRKTASDNNEVIRTLLIHEPKLSSGTGPAPPFAQSRLHESETATSESEDETKRTGAPAIASDMENEDEPVVLNPTVMVAGQPHLYNTVSENPELVSLMTGEEREAYIKVGQEMFQSIFE